MSKLREYQVEPVADIVRHLTAQPGKPLPPDGLRTQLHAACGTGKTFMSAHAALRLARRGAVLVLVPTLDLLGQTIETWRAAGRVGQMFAVCSLADNEPAPGVQCTTSSARLGFWLERAGSAPVTVFGTYASLPAVLGAHIGGLGIAPARPWDLVVVDEAHRTSGSASKAWAAVHDNGQLPAVRRLYMTATPRVWNVPEPEEGGAPAPGVGPESSSPAYQSLPRDLAMSMDDTAVFGTVCNNQLSLARCQELGILARFQIIALEIADPVLYGILENEQESAREARLAAVQVALLKAIKDESLSKVISFHNRLADAEVFATTLPHRVAVEDDLREAFPNGVWARWLSGEHTGRHRRWVLGEFESERPGGKQRPALLSNVKVIAEGVDSRSDAVVFMDSKGSIVDLVQNVGRALRQRPGEGKVASIIVPVIVRKAGTGTVEDAAAGDMVADPVFRPLLDVLQGLRAHDSDLIEGLAVPQRRSRTEQPDPWIEGDEPDREEQPSEGGAPAPRAVLKFAGGEHSAAEIAAAVQLRVLSPEAQSWLRGYAAARRWHALHQNLAVPTNATEPGASTFPLGRWIADQRAAWAKEDLLPSRVERLEELGMVWSAHEAAWEANFAAACAWAAVNGGHLCAPARAVHDGVPVGKWLTEQRSAAARDETMGGLTQSRRERLAGVDPWWCPPWPLPWQRSFRIALAHVENGGTLLDLPEGHLVAGEDIGRWARAQQAKWAELQPERQEMMGWLGITAPIEPVAPELPAAKPKTRKADRFPAGLAAATAWHAEHGTLANVTRKDVQPMPDGTEFKLGVWIMNQRQRAVKLSDDQRAALDALGMRW